MIYKIFKFYSENIIICGKYLIILNNFLNRKLIKIYKKKIFFFIKDFFKDRNKILILTILFNQQSVIYYNKNYVLAKSLSSVKNVQESLNQNLI